MKINQSLIDWLLEGPAWVRKRTRIDLLGFDDDDPLVIQDHQDMLSDPKIKGLIAISKKWEQVLLKRHNDAAHPLHAVSFLSELGLTVHDPGIADIIGLLRKHQSDEGPFQVLSNYPSHFGGSGKDEWLWCLCDAPLILYALAGFGLATDADLRSSIQWLVGLARQNGWPCAATKQLGRFHGPGKREDACPYANLLMLKALSIFQESLEKSIINNGIETQLTLWENRRELHPYLFKMGTDFSKLKAPFIWYDILHVADVLSRFSQCHKDHRFQNIVDTIMSKADNNGMFISESIWAKWKGWEFCQKKEPSRWITFCIARICLRTDFQP
jgi:hypothetical protein